MPSLNHLLMLMHTKWVGYRCWSMSQRHKMSASCTPAWHVLLLIITCLQDLPYWGSWALTHFGQLAITVALCTLALIYPFPNSDASVYAAFLLAVSAALIAFSYAASAVFSKAKVSVVADFQPV